MGFGKIKKGESNMEYRKFGDKYVIRMDRGEEIVATLMDFCRDRQIKLGKVSAIGAVNKVTIGLFKTAEKKYYSSELTGDFEITGLNGNISTMKGEPYLHLHISIADAKHNTYGGHLNSAVVSATCEMIVDVLEGAVDREFSEEIGLNLIKF